MDVDGSESVNETLPKQEDQQQPPVKKQKLDGEEEHNDDQQPQPQPPPEEEEKQKDSPSYYDSEEDDLFYNDGMRTMTVDEGRNYKEVVTASEGFDAPELPDNIFAFGLIYPISNLDEQSSTYEELKSYAILAIAEYNTANGTNFEFLKVLKANISAASSFFYYITFEAKDDAGAADGGQPPMIFETRVYAGVSDTEVEFCRLKRNL